MWRIIRVTKHAYRHQGNIFHETFSQGKRCFLSESFQCHESWKQRLESPIIKQLKLGDMYHQLDQKFQHEGKASPVDIDLFANAVTEEVYIDELEDLIHKLRLSANTGSMLPSTPHAIIRTYLELGKHGDLFRILNDRLNYGIFLDDYCCCLLLDTYIKQNKFTEAAKISVLQMLQEDWDNPLTLHLSLYSCHMFLSHPGTWEEEVPQQEDDSGEEIKVRVAYIRNPYFDDHFDLSDPKLLIGKTLAMVGALLPDPLGRTYHVVGLCLYKKWDKAITVLQQFKEMGCKPVIFKEGVKIVGDVFDAYLAQDNSNSYLKDAKENIMQFLKGLEVAGLLCDENLHSTLVNKVKNIVKVEEKLLIEHQIKTYKDWGNMRERALQEQLQMLQIQERLAVIQKEKQELEKREQELFFFDNEDKWDLIIEKNEALAITKHHKDKKIKKTEDDDYIPPDVK